MQIPDWGTVGILARLELKLCLRHRWTLVYAVIFTILTFSVSYFGLVVLEITGFQGFSRTAASLLNLVLYVVPLATMLMAAQSLSPEGGATDHLFAEPITMGEFVLGKISGLTAAHLIASGVGFGLTGILVGLRVGVAGSAGYLVLVGFTFLLGMVFISLALFLTVATGRGPRSFAVVVLVWFLLVLLFDLLMVGLGFLLPEIWSNRLALTGVLLNPVDATRVAVLLALSGRELFGPAGALLIRALGGTPQAVVLLFASLVCWVLFPALAARLWLQHRDL